MLVTENQRLVTRLSDSFSGITPITGNAVWLSPIKLLQSFNAPESWVPRYCKMFCLSDTKVVCVRACVCARGFVLLCVCLHKCACLGLWLWYSIRGHCLPHLNVTSDGVFFIGTGTSRLWIHVLIRSENIPTEILHFTFPLRSAYNPYRTYFLPVEAKYSIPKTWL